MVEISRDGKRVYFTNSLYGAVDPQFYPDGIDGWMVKLDAGADGGIAFDPTFLRAMAEEPPPASGAPARRRLLVRFLLLSVTATAASYRRKPVSRASGTERPAPGPRLSPG